jgi:hypothetical protein
MPTILSRMLSTLAAAAQTADRIDYWLRRHVIEYWDKTHPSQLKLDPGRDGLGCQQLDNVVRTSTAPSRLPLPLAALVKQLETQKQE